MYAFNLRSVVVIFVMLKAKILIIKKDIMKDIINEKLNEIEKEKGIKILFAIES